MPSETVVNGNGAAERFPSDYGTQSLIRERDPPRPWKTDLSQARDFEFPGERGHAVGGVGCRC